MGTIFRQGRIADVPAIMTIIEAAVDRMLAEGKQQWDETYPTVNHIIDDINSGAAHVLLDGDAVVAYGAVVFAGEPAYRDIYEGDWLSDGTPYVTVHRLAVAPCMQRRGFASRFLDIVCDMAADMGFRSMRVDTNHDNDRMLRLLADNGFERCGIITYEKGQRIAFEKLI